MVARKDKVGDTARVPFRCGKEVWNRGVGGVHRAKSVQFQHPTPLRGVPVDERAKEHDPGVGYHDVQPSEFINRTSNRSTGLRLLGNVRTHRHSSTATMFDLFDEVVEAVDAASRDNDSRAGACKVPGGRLADTAAGAGHESDSPRQRAFRSVFEIGHWTIPSSWL